MTQEYFKDQILRFSFPIKNEEVADYISIGELFLNAEQVRTYPLRVAYTGKENGSFEESVEWGGEGIENGGSYTGKVISPEEAYKIYCENELHHQIILDEYLEEVDIWWKKEQKQRVLNNIQEFENNIKSFSYEIRTWQEAEELHLDEVGFTEEDFNSYSSFYMRESRIGDTWQESVSWQKGNIGDIAEIGKIDVTTVWEVYRRENEAGKITEVLYIDEF